MNSLTPSHPPINSPVIAIGLDSADPILLEKWMAQGHLKTLSRLKAQGSYRRLENTVSYHGVPIPTSSTEKLWVMAMTGCFPDKTKYWDTVKFNPAQYSIFHDEINGGYDYREYPPFYALGEQYKVAAFDIPVTRLSDQVNGLQLLGWGGHFPFSPSDSQPPELLSEITERYGKNPVLYKDHGYWWKPNYASWLRGALQDSIMARTAISCDLLQRDHWDLFLTVFGESHSAGHDLWHLSQPDHPLYETWAQPDQGDAMLEVFECIDQAIAKIIDCAPKTAHIVCFSAHGMGINVTDLYSMTMLPEILYRFNFPGKVALAPGSVGRPPSPPLTRPNRNTWAGEVWSRIYAPKPIQRLLRRWIPSRFLRSGGNTGLVSPYELNEQSSPLSWVPAMWYQRLWPTMRAFALPGFSDGLIRINLQGREAHGIVPPAEYDALCNELIEMLHKLTDARTGQPIVKSVVRSRTSPFENDSTLPDADLVVLWHERPCDVVDHPTLGRIGPVPYSRPGGHRPQGFLILDSPGENTQSLHSQAGGAIDLAPTLLDLMNVSIPQYIDGKSLLSREHATHPE